MNVTFPGLYSGAGLGLALPDDGIDQPEFVPAPGSPGSSAGSLNLPASPEAAIWRAFVDLVTLDPTLAGIVTFKSWDGADGSEQDPDLADGRPWVRMSPSAGKSGPFAMGIWATPMIVHVDVITPGTNVTDSMNLWNQIRSVVTDPGFREAMRTAGVSSIRPADPAYGVKPTLPKYEPTAAGTITAIGTIELRIYRRQP